MYTDKDNQVVETVFSNICATYRLEVPNSQWDTAPKVVENNRAKILWDFEFQTEKQLPKNQPDRVVVHKEQNTRAEHHSVIDVAVPGDSNIRKKVHKEIVLGS